MTAESNTSFEKYQAEPGHWEDEPVIVLRDNGSGSVAMIAPALGSNCVFWSIQFNNQEVQVIETPVSPAVMHERPTRAGVPVLFPFPGRVRNARYEFDGHEYHLPNNDKSGVHAIHGIVFNVAWEVGEYGSSDEGAYAVMRVKPENLLEEFRKGYPFNFELAIRFVLRERSLTYRVTLENHETQQTIPFGFGIHPYVRVPLIATEEAPDRTVCPVHISATTQWPTEEGLPTGPALPTAPNKDFSGWQKLGTEPFDDMYSGVTSESGWTFADYRSPGTGLEVRIRADHNFHDWVLFTPPNRPSLAIEPYTCPPNAINMAQEGIKDNHLLTLAPGQSWQAEVVLEVL